MKFRKFILSMSLLVAVLLTMIATTFAWVGITSNSVFDEFVLSLKANDDVGDYGVQLSLDGRPGTFADSIDSISVKKQILKNWGYNTDKVDNMSDDGVNIQFSNHKLDQCTPYTNQYQQELFSSNSLQYFQNVVSGQQTLNYIWLDVYATLYITKISASEDIPLSLYLRESVLSSDDIGTTTLLNKYKYPTTPYELNSLAFTPAFLGKEFSGNVSVNPASAARICVQSFKPVDLYEMTVGESLYSTIYQYDSSMPYYDNYNKVYSFGGILPAEYNMAYQQYNLSHMGAELPEIPDWQINRGDVTYEDKDEIGRICNKDTDGLIVGKMMKFRIYFWFEGWDSDCFEVIDNRNVEVNLLFSNKAPYDI